jgi:hypothetical protein
MILSFERIDQKRGIIYVALTNVNILCFCQVTLRLPSRKGQAAYDTN